MAALFVSNSVEVDRQPCPETFPVLLDIVHLQENFWFKIVPNTCSFNSSQMSWKCFARCKLARLLESFPNHQRMELWRNEPEMKLKQNLKEFHPSMLIMLSCSCMFSCHGLFTSLDQLQAVYFFYTSQKYVLWGSFSNYLQLPSRPCLLFQGYINGFLIVLKYPCCCVCVCITSTLAHVHVIPKNLQNLL